MSNIHSCSDCGIDKTGPCSLFQTIDTVNIASISPFLCFQGDKDLEMKKKPNKSFFCVPTCVSCKIRIARFWQHFLPPTIAPAPKTSSKSVTASLTMDASDARKKCICQITGLSIRGFLPPQLVAGNFLHSGTQFK